MAASRRDTSLSIRLPATPTLLPDRPPISALFLIDFDVKAGYTIVWKQAEPGLEIEGTVEYKSLPSGLHTVQDDLIYFVHEDGYAGLSAFINSRTDDEETRHARMIAVGVLVPLTYGRLGRSWRHAEALTDMARCVQNKAGAPSRVSNPQLLGNSPKTGSKPRFWSATGPRTGRKTRATPSSHCETRP